MHVPHAAKQFNEHRNTSRVFPVPPNALPDAQRALAAFRRDDPALVQWIEDGHPTLTEAEHLARFGEPYQGAPLEGPRLRVRGYAEAGR